jgi:hypothetical protein
MLLNAITWNIKGWVLLGEEELTNNFLLKSLDILTIHLNSNKINMNLLSMGVTQYNKAYV